MALARRKRAGYLTGVCAAALFGSVMLPALIVHGLFGDSARAADPPRGAPARTGLPLRFDSEIVRIFVEKESLKVEGIYNMICRPTQGAQITLFYPYPEDSLLGGARTLSVACRSGSAPWEPLKFAEVVQRPGARWWVPLGRGDTLSVRSVYRQERRASYARYVVTTTSAWGRPLSHARFEIYLPAGARDMEFSFPFGRGEGAGGECYVYEAVDFMPSHDITVTWKP